MSRLLEGTVAALLVLGYASVALAVVVREDGLGNGWAMVAGPCPTSVNRLDRRHDG